MQIKKINETYFSKWQRVSEYNKTRDTAIPLIASTKVKNEKSIEEMKKLKDFYN